jgi:hypothetical protein
MSQSKDAALIAAREAKTRLLDLEYQRKCGALIDAARAEHTVFTFVRAERDSWLSWIARTAPVLAGELAVDEHAVFHALDRHVREHLEHLADVPLVDLAAND